MEVRKEHLFRCQPTTLFELWLLDLDDQFGAECLLHRADHCAGAFVALVGETDAVPGAGLNDH